MNTKPSSGGAAPSEACFELKGSVLTLVELRLLKNDLTHFSYELTRKIRQAPDFFNQAPVVIDLSELPVGTSPVDFKQISTLLQENKLLLVGVRNGTPNNSSAAQAQGLHVLPPTFGNKDTGSKTSSDHRAAAEGAGKAQADKANDSEVGAKGASDAVVEQAPVFTPSQVSSPSKTIFHPIRSGQQVYAKGCDLVVLATVSEGAEIIADGNIHVYGALRGRALAGVHGDESARIFCRQLDAQLLSIAGYYRVIEEIEHSVRNKSVQIYLKEKRVTIERF